MCTCVRHPSIIPFLSNKACSHIHTLCTLRSVRTRPVRWTHVAISGLTPVTVNIHTLHLETAENTSRSLTKIVQLDFDLIAPEIGVMGNITCCIGTLEGVNVLRLAHLSNQKKKFIINQENHYLLNRNDLFMLLSYIQPARTVCLIL